MRNLSLLMLVVVSSSVFSGCAMHCGIVKRRPPLIYAPTPVPELPPSVPVLPPLPPASAPELPKFESGAEEPKAEQERGPALPPPRFVPSRYPVA